MKFTEIEIDGRRTRVNVIFSEKDPSVTVMVLDQLVRDEFNNHQFKFKLSEDNSAHIPPATSQRENDLFDAIGKMLLKEYSEEIKKIINS